MSDTAPPQRDDVAALTAALSPEKRRLLEQRLRTRSRVSSSIVRSERSAPVAMSAAQKSLLLLHATNENLVAYNVAHAMRISGRLDLDALCGAFDDLYARHSVLRSAFSIAGGEPRVDVAPVGRCDVVVRDIADEDVSRFVHRAVTEPFDLRSGRLLRARIGIIGPNDHVVVVSTHHIVSDAQSKAVLSRELDELYQARRDGRPTTLQPLRVDFLDFAAWESARTDVADDVRWWRSNLAGAPDQNDLPVDRSRPPAADYSGAKHNHRLDQELVEAAMEFARTRRATLFMVLLAAYAGLLRRYGTQDDVVVGSPTSGRHDGTLAEVVGLFLTMLPLRLDVSGDPTFAELVERTRQVATDAYRHQSVPFDRMVEELRPPRVLGRNPVFQTMFTVKQGADHAPTLDGLTVAPINYEGGWTKFDLTVICAAAPHGMSVLWQYATALFDRETIVGIATHFERFLRAGLSSPDTPLSALPLAEDDDVAAVQEANRTASAGEPVPLLDMIAEQVSRNPDARAVGDARGWLTFGEMDERANRLAHHLVSLGVGADSRVAIYLERSVELEVAILAVLKAGGAYVPLDTGYPADRLAFMVEDSAAVALLTTRNFGDVWPDARHLVLVDDLDLADAPSDPPRVEIKPEHLAYVLYTSGTTGRPKGVQIEHRAMANQIEWLRRDLGIGPADTLLQKTPISFDVAGWEVLLAPCSGARLFMARPLGHLEPDYLLETIEQHGVSVVNFVPSMLRVFLDRVGAGDCAALRALTVAGEALTDELKDRCLRVLPGTRLWNIYGPTETIGITSEECLPQRTVTIGMPADRCVAYVLDSGRTHQPIGMPGELYLGGHQVARGYLGRPGLTAERFVDTELGRLYRTGDRAAWRPDGRLAFFGRLDEQVKLRGFRIELGEIESVLAAHSDVQAACAVIGTSPAGEPMLSAFVTAGSGLVGPPGPKVVDAAVENWRDRWDEAYGEPSSGDPTFDIRFPADDGATRRPSHHELRDRVGATAERVAALNPSSILEVGIGAGALMWRLAPRVEHYDGVDFASRAIGILNANRQHFENATVARQAAHELTPPVPGRHYDCVLLDSVAHYFPDEKYLRTVLARALGIVTDGGTVFVGDVRDLRLQDAGPLEDILSAGPATSAVDLRTLLDDNRLLEPELLLDPAVFFDLPGVDHVQVRPQRGRSGMNRFRYDVVLHTAPGTAVAVAEWLEWPHGGSSEWLERRLAGHSGDSFGVLGVPNTRVSAIDAALRDLADGRLPDLQPAAAGLDPDDIVRLGAIAGYQVEISCARERGVMDVAFTRSNAPVRFPHIPAAASGMLTNEPLLAAATVTARTELVKQLNILVRDRLPDYMVPTTIRVLDRLQLGPTGKLDRRALTELTLQITRAEPVLPRTNTETRLAAIWQKTLGLAAPISVDDNFFDLGGSSLLALSLFPIIEQEFHLKLPVAVLFEHTTVAEIAAWIDAEAQRHDDWDLLVPMRRSGHKRALFLMPSQRGDVLPYRQLVDAIDHDRPVYGIQCVGLDGRQAPRTAIEEIAADCVIAIRTAQPTGPYLIGGYCFGGVVAFEVANQLIAAGDHVEYCGLIDAAPFGRGGELSAHLRKPLSRRLTWRSRAELRRKVAFVRMVARGRLNFRITQIYGRTGARIPRRFVDVHAANRVAMNSYVTPDVPVKVTLFRAASGSTEADEIRRRRWDMVSAGVEMHVVSGYRMGHWQIVRAEHVPRLAPLIDASLADLL